MNKTLTQIESEVLSEGREWTRLHLEKRLQEQADAMVVCLQSGLLLKRLRKFTFTLNTSVGVVTIHAPYGYSTHANRYLCPTRQSWGLESHQRLSPEFERRLTFTVTQTGSFEKAAALSSNWGSPISDDAIHAMVQRVGARAERTPTPPPVIKPSSPQFSLVIMMDGWMVRQRGLQWGEPPQLGQKLERVTWNEVKSAVIYRLEDRAENESGRGLLIEKYVVACPPQTTPIEFGAAVQKEAMLRGMARAKEVLVVADGAIWIWRIIEDRFATATKTLDFYHGSQHLWDLANYLHPSAPEAARQWIEPLLHSLRHDPQHRVIEKLEKLVCPSPEGVAPDSSLTTKVEYFLSHREHLQYAELAARGAPIGSGSMESQCSQFQDRLKRRGQFWSRKGLRNLLALDVAVKNHSYTHLWN